MNKAQLYAVINRGRTHLQLHDDYPINSKYLASRFRNRLTIEQHRFSSYSIGGILMKGEKHSMMSLNSQRDDIEQNFDCMHELIHFLFPHPPNTYTCYNKPTQDGYYEWEANEGAAESLVPYYKFIPELCEVYYYILKGRHYNYLKHFSEKYYVTEKVIKVRIESLTYEINQYLAGIRLDRLRILSRKHQQRLGIYVPSFLDPLDLALNDRNFDAKLIKYRLENILSGRAR